jgi:hypothetical protein
MGTLSVHVSVSTSGCATPSSVNRRWKRHESSHCGSAAFRLRGGGGAVPHLRFPAPAEALVVDVAVCADAAGHEHAPGRPARGHPCAAPRPQLCLYLPLCLCLSLCRDDEARRQRTLRGGGRANRRRCNARTATGPAPAGAGCWPRSAGANRLCQSASARVSNCWRRLAAVVGRTCSPRS